ncbi:MAG: biotin/lipoyl-binding protein [Candidatus Bathyarchaeota archaeon]|nr:MAG: biotin/lipoyl-binding protein [Candidatus Bathyarchaeota archaeon]
MPVYEVFIDGKPLRVEITRTVENCFAARIGDKSFSIKLPVDRFNSEKETPIRVDCKAYKIELPKINREKPISIKVNEATFEAEVRPPKGKPAWTIPEQTYSTPPKRTVVPKQEVEGVVTAPMTGKISSVMVKNGDHVKAGQIVCILEAMKMENEITTAKAGTVQKVYVLEGSSVHEGEPLVVIV